MNRRAAAALLVLVAVLSLGTATAASLELDGAMLTVTSAEHPCPGAVQVRASGPTATGVQVTAPAACAGRTLQIAVGATPRTGTAGLTGGTQTVALDAGVAVGDQTPVAVVVDGWHSAVQWSVAAPAPAVTCTTGDDARPCEATLRVRDGWATGYNLDITVRDARPGNANNPVPWQVTIDFSTADVPFVPTGFEGSGVVVESRCGDLPRVTFSGVTTWGEHHLLRRGDSRTVWLQARNDGSGGLLRCS